MSDLYDVIVVGAGLGGLYGVKRFRDQGLRVIGLEAAPDIGGVWYHNAYPGARVDVESLYYCYFFDPDLYQEWTWTEKYATQPELLAYLRHVTDRHDLRRSFQFNTRVVGGRWDPESDRWEVSTENGRSFAGRYLVMATGQLSKSRRPPFPGLDDFAGEWAQTSEWRSVGLDDRRVAVVGTGSSGVQAVTAISKRAAHTFVLQRTPGYVIPVLNGPFDTEKHARVVASFADTRERLLNSAIGVDAPEPLGLAGDFTPAEQQSLLEQRWHQHQFGVTRAFSDIGTDLEASEVVARFVRRKTRERIHDPTLADKLIQTDYPIGVRRVVWDTGYYESFNQDNVTLVDVAEDPIERIVASGIRLRSGRILDVDTIVFAIGFEAFTGAIEAAGLRNEHGAAPTDHWQRGPQTYLGLMTCGFANMFILQGPGSPSTLAANMNLSAVATMDFVGDLLAHAGRLGATRIEPEQQAVDWWTAHAAEIAEPLLRRQDDNYMVHVNDDGSRVLIPYTGGVGRYFRHCADVAAAGFAGFEFSGAGDQARS